MAAFWPGMFFEWMVFAAIATGFREENSEVAQQLELVAESVGDVDECLALKRTDSTCFYTNLCNRSLSLPGYKDPLSQHAHGQFTSPYSCDTYPVEAFQRYRAHEFDKWQKQKTCWKTESISILGSTKCFAKNTCDFKLQVACHDKVTTAEAMYENQVDDIYCSCKEVPPEPVETFPKKWSVENGAKEDCFGVKKQDGKCLARNYCDESIEVEGGFQPFKANWRGRMTSPSVCDRFSQKAFDVFFNNEETQWEAEVQKWQMQQNCFHSVKTVNGRCVISNACAEESLVVRCNNCERYLTVEAHKDYFAANTCFCDCDRPKPSEPTRSE